MPHRCAFGCEDTSVVMHVFPNPEKFPERFKTWVSLIGGKLETSSDFDFFKKKRICDIHFTDAQKNRNKRLNALAVPTLHLPASSKSQQPFTDGQCNTAAELPTVNIETTVTQLSNTTNKTQTATVSTIPTASLASSKSQQPFTDGQCNTAAELPTGNMETTVTQLSNTTSETQTVTVSTIPTASLALSKSQQAITDGQCNTAAELPTGNMETTVTKLSNTTSETQTATVSTIPTASLGEISAAAAATVNEHNYSVISRRGQNIFQEASVTQLSNITSEIQTAIVSAIPTASSGERSAAAIVNEHNYSVISRRGRNIYQDAPRRKADSMLLKPLQTQVRYLRTEVCRLRKKGKSFKQRLYNAEKLCNNVAFNRLVRTMTKPAQLFLNMQQQTGKKPKGRRFTTEEKILSLSLFKRSPKSYKLLCKFFTLPSAKSMKRLLSQIQLRPGINPIIFEKIKKSLSEKDVSDRLCSLSFDEMSITPQVTFNSQKDCLEGFATNNENMFADHALVFMVKGVKNNFKQPVAYYFTNSLNKVQLKNMIKTVTQHALESGLIVVNTVCDQSPVNVGAITELVNDTKASYLRHGKEWRHDHFLVKGKAIIPLYDTPHLIKGLRNNLLTKDLVYTIDKTEKRVKWEYYQKVYEADKSYGELRLLDKLTEEHINPEKIKKMRVKSATQLFSHSVAVATEHLTGRGDLPEECRQLIDFTLLIDNLFDTLNGSSLSIPNGKIYKGPVKNNSPHHELWQNAKKVLKTVKYIKKIQEGNKTRFVETVAPSVTNLIKTIEGMESLWKVLSNKYGLDAMLTRNLNQDPLENFFGNIRSYGARNIAPNTVAFEGAFKALMLNNFACPHSRRANCEEDANECLQTLDFFLREKNDTHRIPEEDKITVNNEMCLDLQYESDAGQRNYVCGWIIKKCLTNVVKSCPQCRKLLQESSENKNNAFIQAKEYNKNKKWLCYPSEEIEKFFQDVQNITSSILQKNVPKKGLKLSITVYLDLFIDDPFVCSKHKVNLKKYFIETCLNVLIFSWCRSVNRILSGKVKYNGSDQIKSEAQKYFNKHRNYKNRK